MTRTADLAEGIGDNAGVAMQLAGVKRGTEEVAFRDDTLCLEDEKLVDGPALPVGARCVSCLPPSSTVAYQFWNSLNTAQASS